MATPTVDQFLTEISRIVREQNSLQLQDYLVVEPPYGQTYQSMIRELRQVFPKGSETALEAKCEGTIPEAQGNAETGSWSAFIKFMVQYLTFLRDVNTQNLLETYNLLNELVQKCNNALGQSTFGIIILPTVISYSRMLARLAIGLDKQPHLIAHLTKQSTNEGGDEGGSRETLPERAANIMRQAFTICLTDRSGDASGLKDGKPDGKKAGIYRIANLCLKVLFQCRKIRNAEQMFSNIDNQAPNLSAYPRSERVTYLYYLGRFYFASNHFWRAQLALQQAYAECHKQCVKQSRLILIYLMAANIILGKFPSQRLLQRPEAQGLAEMFLPICHAIRQGDLASFREIFDLEDLGSKGEWLLCFRIYLPLRNRCEVLVWRTLFRRTFQLSGVVPPADTLRAPTLSLYDVQQLASVLTTNSSNSKVYIDPDLEGIVDEQEQEPKVEIPSMLEIESIASSLLVQGFLNGFISHSQRKYAISGAKKSNSLIAGFPNVWQTIASRSNENVPGLVKVTKPKANPFGPGRVVNLSGIARPTGAAG